MAMIPHGHPSDMWLGELSDKMQSYDEVRSVGICSPACGSVSLCVWEELNKETGRDHCHSHWLISQTTCPKGVRVGLSCLVSQLWWGAGDGPRGAGHTLLSPNHKSPHNVVLISGGRIGYAISRTQCKIQM